MSGTGTSSSSQPLTTMPKAGLAYALCAVMIWTGFILVSKAGALAALATPDLIMVRFGTAFMFPRRYVRRHAMQ